MVAIASKLIVKLPPGLAPAAAGIVPAWTSCPTMLDDQLVMPVTEELAGEPKLPGKRTQADFITLLVLLVKVTEKVVVAPAVALLGEITTDTSPEVTASAKVAVAVAILVPVRPAGVQTPVPVQAPLHPVKT